MKAFASTTLFILGMVSTLNGHPSLPPPNQEAPGMAAQTPAGLELLGPDGTTLHFANDEELLDFLRTATVVASEEIGMGRSGALKIRLEKDGQQANAAFRTVDERSSRVTTMSGQTYRNFRDSYRFECAAYELSRILGFDNVPACVLRAIDDKEGSVQIWVEKAMTEGGRVDAGLPAPGGVRWFQQTQLMYLFDALLFNFDRNQGNVLIDERGKIWFIDHTRSFSMEEDVEKIDRITVCDRGVWEKLKSLDEAMLTERLGPYLVPSDMERQIGSLLERNEKLVKHLEEAIAAKGEAQVLFVLMPPPVPEPAVTN
ncbi:MAG: hypothetical protein ACRD1X_21890 [Vicinamibacteria bacterium]